MNFSSHQAYPSMEIQPAASQDVGNALRNEEGYEPVPLWTRSIFDGTHDSSISANSLVKFLNWILDSHVYVFMMSILTIWVLFSDDIRISACTKNEDDVFFGISTAILCFFTFDLVASLITKKDYRFSFYFWLDLLSTLSIIPDIGWIWYPLIGINSDSEDGQSKVKYTKSANQGNQASRIVRIVRLIRLIRIVKLYKNARIAMIEEDEDGQVHTEIDMIPKESRVGKKLSELTMKRVIVLVFILVSLIPLFNLEFYVTPQRSWTFGLNTVENFLGQDGFISIRDEYIDYHKDDRRPLIYFTYTYGSEVYVWETSTNPNDLRSTEKYVVNDDHSQAIIDLRPDTHLDSELNICKTIFVCIILTFGALTFTKDSEDLVVFPIESMIRKIRKIARNPLNAGILSSENRSASSIENQKKKFFCFNRKAEKAEYETTLLENTIVKIGALLALGFGEAGSKIIATNMEKSGDVDPVLQGNKIAAIYGFCDIRNFTDTTEELQESVMVFVNEIAYIVHTVTHQLMGAANKNIGDAFLIVWKFGEDDILELNDPLVLNHNSRKAGFLGDLALLSFLKIIAKINKDPKILKYRNHGRLIKRMPNYAVKMGFGLHVGWSIEGAIGSEFKIDASYLSPHVNMSGRLEEMTKIYGVPLLLSGAFYDILSPTVQGYCRHLDIVMIKGHTNPLRLYTSDTDPSNVFPGEGLDKSKEQTTRLRKALKGKLDRGQLESWELFEDSREVAALKEPYTDEFYEKHRKGMEAYLKGDWTEAKGFFEATLIAKPADGPTMTLLSFIKENNFEAPLGWEGCRDLIDK